MSDSRELAPDTGPSPPIADSVRLARPSEAQQISAIQRRGWETDLDPSFAAALLAAGDLDQMTEIWNRSIAKPPLAQCRVLVAVDGASGLLTGFAMTMPSDDPDADQSRDGMIGEFVIDPRARGRGHGSRLLNAAVETLVADRYKIAQTWVRSDADGSRRFLTSAGWAADGSHRELGDSESTARIKQVRLHTSID